MLWRALTSPPQKLAPKIPPNCTFHFTPFHHLFFEAITALVCLFSVLLHLLSFLLTYFCPFSFCSALQNNREWTSNLWGQEVRNSEWTKARFSLADWQKRWGCLWTLTCHCTFSLLCCSCPNSTWFTGTSTEIGPLLICWKTILAIDL